MGVYRSLEHKGGSVIMTALILLLVVLVTVPSRAGGTVLPRQVHSKPLHTLIVAGQSRDVVHVKFAEGSSLTLRNGTITDSGMGSYPGLESVLSTYPLAAAQRLFSEPEADMKAMKAELGAATGEELPDLSL